ncbi:hypothetical protein I4I73_13035 [Pseudonocardia sp. KRD-184]|uniref:DUF2637 domain-containing protein n=1 Tax=Pseudonocardia oceani TaxID=2792013 RepID=A0ABS6U8C7_9PSEU|nr:hypothetical protein [Pseudonocardia oceani]MBW0096911.1 hypothetical protein [Pseudonocardia oceani]MBW0123726.1 hypothetical protein [Pseudonocardia oceani]MBW0128497.1 hypothetical protein [Pseudonocardia oceani]
MTSSTEPRGRVIRAVIWLPGLAVALGAAVATAHGLYEVAHAARVPAGIAWLYPLITDGLALVAYAATARLSRSAARYAWSVVVLAAGLSGLAQAAFLASGSAVEASAALRFGVGAIAAAIVAHLLYLLATDESGSSRGVQPEPFNPAPVQPDPPTVQEVAARAVQPAPPAAVQPPPEVAAPAGRPALAPAPVEQPVVAPARERARAAAMRHAHRHGALPTVTQLEAAAEVSRGTASAALKHLRAQPTPLHLITRSTEQSDPSEHDDDPTIERATQP